MIFYYLAFGHLDNAVSITKCIFQVVGNQNRRQIKLLTQFISRTLTIWAERIKRGGGFVKQ